MISNAMLRRLGPLVLVGAVLGLGPIARANVLLNPSFETPNLAQGYMNFTAGETIGAGWVVEGGIAAVMTDGHGDIYPEHPKSTDGDQNLYVNNRLAASSLYQDVLLEGGTNYRLTFDLSSFLEDLSPGAELSVDLLTNGSSILGAPVVFSRPAFAGFAQQQLDFTTTTAGTYRLLLSAPNNHGTFVDNFSLAATPAAVPEPASIAMVGLGMLAIPLAARYRGRAGRMVRGFRAE